MTNNRFSIEDFMVIDANSDPVEKVYIREILDYPSSEFRSSKLSAQNKIEIINALGLETLTMVLEKCFQQNGKAYNAEKEAQFTWMMLSKIKSKTF